MELVLLHGSLVYAIAPNRKYVPICDGVSRKPIFGERFIAISKTY